MVSNLGGSGKDNEMQNLKEHTWMTDLCAKKVRRLRDGFEFELLTPLGCSFQGS